MNALAAPYATFNVPPQPEETGSRFSLMQLARRAGPVALVATLASGCSFSSGTPETTPTTTITAPRVTSVAPAPVPAPVEQKTAEVPDGLYKSVTLTETSSGVEVESLRKDLRKINCAVGSGDAMDQDTWGSVHRVQVGAKVTNWEQPKAATVGPQTIAAIEKAIAAKNTACGDNMVAVSKPASVNTPAPKPAQSVATPNHLDLTVTPDCNYVQANRPAACNTTTKDWTQR